MEEYKENTKQGIKDKHEQEIPCKGLYIDCWTFIFNNGSFKPVLAKEPSIVKKKKLQAKFLIPEVVELFDFVQFGKNLYEPLY